MFVVFLSVLSLVSVSHSTPQTCETLLQPLADLRLQDIAGRWALVASSVKNTAVADILRNRDSLSIDVSNSTYTQANRDNGECSYRKRIFSVEDQKLKMTAGVFNFTVTFHQTSCQDCALLMMDIESPNTKTLDFYLLSRRRQVEEKEMEEFNAQVQCLNLPPPVVMDPTKDLCPEETASNP